MLEPTWILEQVASCCLRTLAWKATCKRNQSCLIYAHLSKNVISSESPSLTPSNLIDFDPAASHSCYSPTLVIKAAFGLTTFSLHTSTRLQPNLGRGSPCPICLPPHRQHQYLLNRNMVKASRVFTVIPSIPNMVFETWCLVGRFARKVLAAFLKQVSRQMLEPTPQVAPVVCVIQHPWPRV